MVSIQGRLQEYDLGSSFVVSDNPEGGDPFRNTETFLFPSGHVRNERRAEERDRRRKIVLFPGGPGGGNPHNR